MKLLPASLQGRLLVLVLGAVTGVWLAAAAFTWIDARHEIDELLDGHLAQAAALLVVQQARELGEDRDAADAPILHRYAPKVAFQVFHEGQLALRSPNAPDLPMTASGRPFEPGFTTVKVAGIAWRVFAAEGAEHDVQVYVSERVDSRGSILWAVLRSSLAPMLAALPLLALALWWAVYSGVAPLRKLGRTLAERQPQALESVTLDRPPSEMIPMLDALNALFGRIARVMEAERRFTSDAAHELRTPIAAIRAQAQVALAETDGAQRRHALLATLQGCDRATRLVEQLLTLSRLDAGAVPDLVPIELAALVRQVVSETAAGAIAKRQEIELDAAPGCLVRGDPVLLSVLVRNLVDNAIRYSPPGAKLRISILAPDDSVSLRVEDSGPGVGAADAQRLGERFFRILGSGEEGSGLGWSIVRRVAAAHEAQVQIGRSERLGGLAVEIGFPARAGAAAAARAKLICSQRTPLVTRL